MGSAFKCSRDSTRARTPATMPGHVDLEARLDQLLEHAQLPHQRIARTLEHYSASRIMAAWPLGDTL